MICEFLAFRGVDHNSIHETGQQLNPNTVPTRGADDPWRCNASHPTTAIRRQVVFCATNRVALPKSKATTPGNRLVPEDGPGRWGLMG